MPYAKCSRSCLPFDELRLTLDRYLLPHSPCYRKHEDAAVRDRQQLTQPAAPSVHGQ